MSGHKDITGCDASRTENQDNVVENGMTSIITETNVLITDKICK